MMHILFILSFIFADPNFEALSGDQSSEDPSKLEGVANGIDCCHLDDADGAPIFSNTNPDKDRKGKGASEAEN